MKKRWILALIGLAVLAAGGLAWSGPEKEPIPKVTVLTEDYCLVQSFNQMVSLCTKESEAVYGVLVQQDVLRVGVTDAFVMVEQDPLEYDAKNGYIANNGGLCYYILPIPQGTQVMGKTLLGPYTEDEFHARCEQLTGTVFDDWE